MDIITEQIQRVQQAIRDGVVTRRGLARVAQIRDTTLIRALRPSWNPEARTLAAIVSALDELGVPRRPRQRRPSGDGLAA